MKIALQERTGTASPNVEQASLEIGHGTGERRPHMGLAVGAENIPGDGQIRQPGIDGGVWPRCLDISTTPLRLPPNENVSYPRCLRPQTARIHAGSARRRMRQSRNSTPPRFR